MAEPLAEKMACLKVIPKADLWVDLTVGWSEHYTADSMVGPWADQTVDWTTRLKAAQMAGSLAESTVELQADM